MLHLKDRKSEANLQKNKMDSKITLVKKSVSDWV